MFISAGIICATMTLSSYNMNYPTSGVINDTTPNVNNLANEYDDLTNMSNSLIEGSREIIEQSLPTLNIVASTPIYGAYMKTYEDYRVFNHNSNQYKLQSLCYTENDSGLRYIDYQNERYYCCAVGTAVSTTIGQLGRLQLSDGTTINIIVSDVKDDRDTNNSNTVTTHSKCASEFVVDSYNLNREWKRMGSVFYDRGDVISIDMSDTYIPL